MEFVPLLVSLYANFEEHSLGSVSYHSFGRLLKQGGVEWTNEEDANKTVRNGIK